MYIAHKINVLLLKHPEVTRTYLKDCESLLCPQRTMRGQRTWITLGLTSCHRKALNPEEGWLKVADLRFAIFSALTLMISLE